MRAVRVRHPCDWRVGACDSTETTQRWRSGRLHHTRHRGRAGPLTSRHDDSRRSNRAMFCRIAVDQRFDDCIAAPSTTSTDAASGVEDGKPRSRPSSTTVSPVGTSWARPIASHSDPLRARQPVRGGARELTSKRGDRHPMGSGDTRGAADSIATGGERPVPGTPTTCAPARRAARADLTWRGRETAVSGSAITDRVSPSVEGVYA